MKILVGDILKSRAQTLVNSVNCVGVMGRGIALEFKKRFPGMFDHYVKKCSRREVKLGVPYLYRTLFSPQIVNFPTKDHWQSISRIQDIERGLEYLLAHYEEWGITSIAIPPLGCGNGQLEWSEVGPLIYRYAKQMDIPIELYAPHGTPSKELTVKFLSEGPSEDRTQPISKTTQRAVKPAWVALVEILRRIEEQPYHRPIGRTVFQKIAYTATREGLPTGFVYQAGSFGPFCKELKNAATRLVNSNLLQEERQGSMFVVRPGSSFARAKKRHGSSLSGWTSIIEKTADLFMRTNTSQAEIVATVMYATDSLARRRVGKPTETEVLETILQWKRKRRPALEKSAVASTIRNLAILHWLDVDPDPGLPVSEDESVAM